VTRPTDVRVAARILAEEARRGLEGHPSPEEWAAYHDGELPPEEADRLQDHLVLCPDCAGLVLDLDAFQRVAEREEERPGEPAAVGWPPLRDRLQAEGRLAPAAPRSAPARPRAPRLYPVARAAALVLTVGGLSLWVYSLQETLGRQSLPRVNVPLRDLAPEEGRRAGGAEAETVRVPRGQDRFVVILNPRDPEAPAGGALELVDAGGRVVWSAGIGAAPDGPLTLELSRRFLAAGTYRVRVYAPAGSVPHARYSFILEYE
jgi:hypothetical protein